MDRAFSSLRNASQDEVYRIVGASGERAEVVALLHPDPFRLHGRQDGGAAVLLVIGEGGAVDRHCRHLRQLAGIEHRHGDETQALLLAVVGGAGVRTGSQGGQPGGATASGRTPGGPYLFDLIQTSAPINPGNSGGLLVDLEGRVVGINTLDAGLAEPGVPSQGISFAIAINTDKKVATELIAHGHVTYAFLGVGTVDNTPALASQYGLPDVPGVAVYSIAPGSPAEQAGIASKDVLTQIGSTAIQTTGDLQQALTEQKPGDTVHIQWVKAGTNQKMAKDVVLIQSPAAPTP